MERGKNEIVRGTFEKIGSTTKEVVINTIYKIYAYQAQDSFCPNYYNYPKVFLKGIEEHESYNDWRKVPAFRCGIHFYVFTNYKTPKKYDELLKSVDSQFGINCCSVDGFDDLVKLFYENEVAGKLIASKEEYLESGVMCYVGNIANRYLYVTKKFYRGRNRSCGCRETGYRTNNQILCKAV